MPKVKEFKTIVPKLVSIETNKKSILGFYLAEDMDFFRPTKQRLPFHYQIIEDRKITIPTEYDFRNGYFTKKQGVWYYERKLSIFNLKFSYDPKKRIFRFNKSFGKVPFELGGMLPAGKLIADIINQELFFANKIMFHGCAVAFHDETVCLIGLGYNGKTTFVKKSMEQGAKYIAEDKVILDLEQHVVYPTSLFHQRISFSRGSNKDLHRSMNGEKIASTPMKIDRLLLIQNSIGKMPEAQTGQTRQPDQADKDIQDYLITCSLSFLKNNLARSIIFEDGLVEKLFDIIETIKKKRDRYRYINLHNFNFAEIFKPIAKKTLEFEKLLKTDGKHEVFKGIPIILDYTKLPEHIVGQIKYFGSEFAAVKKYELDDWQESYVNKFVKQFPDVRGKLILDCGAGAGYMTIELAKRGAYVVATDLTVESLVNIRKAAKELGIEDRVYSVCCNTEDLPFKDGVFDYYISNAVLEHIPDEPSAIKEIDRVCKPKAGLMITVPLLIRFTNPVFLGLNIYNDRKVGHLRRYDEKVIAKKFTKSKFKIKKNYYTGHFVKVLLTVVSLGFNTRRFNKYAEKIDSYTEGLKWEANNIISFLER